MTRPTASGQLCLRSATRISRKRFPPRRYGRQGRQADHHPLTTPPPPYWTTPLSAARMRGAGGTTPPEAAVRPQPSRQSPRHGHRRRRPSFPGSRRPPGAGSPALLCGGAAAPPRCLQAPPCPHRPAGAGPLCHGRFSAAPFFALSPPVPPCLPLPAAPFLSHSAPRRAMDHNGEEGRGGGPPGRGTARGAALRGEGGAGLGGGPAPSSGARRDPAGPRVRVRGLSRAPSAELAVPSPSRLLRAPFGCGAGR